MKDWKMMFLFKQVIFRFVLIFQRVLVDFSLIDGLHLAVVSDDPLLLPTDMLCKRPLQPFVEELNKIAFASYRCGRKPCYDEKK